MIIDPQNQTMGNYPKTPYSIMIDGFCYTVHEQEKHKFFITHETPRNQVSSLVETGMFVFSPGKIWHVEGESNINQQHRFKIFHAIESEILKLELENFEKYCSN